MVLLSMASLLGLASFTGVGAATPPVAPIPASDPLAAAFSPLDKGDYRDQDIATLTALVGQRAIDDNGWDPNEEQFTVGLEFDSYRPDSWFGVEAGFYYGNDESGGGIGQTTEVALGLRKTFSIGQTGLHPYVGAGVAYLWATNGIDGALVGLPGVDITQTDESVAFYGRGGLYYTIARINIGVDVRALFGSDIDAFGAESADYVQIAGTIGYGF